MIVINEVKAMKSYVKAIKAKKQTIALVPTMGYLHEGHLHLMHKARNLADHLIISIFVNPTQFGPNEDLESYPRDLEHDKKIAAQARAECIFHPTPEEMYPQDYTTYVFVGGLSSILCGLSRPTHFQGVATVCAKLFNIIEPDVAIFGDKDYQQLCVIKRMVEDLNMNVQIIGHPTVREDDGLAMSSRNVYLNPEERQNALVLYKSLLHARELYQTGQRDAPVIRDAMIKMIEATLGAMIDYIEIVDPDNLEPLTIIERGAVVALAVRFGKTRLIDNMLISG
jgi:pantoate--beta-alanine ligase